MVDYKTKKDRAYVFYRELHIRQGSFISSLIQSIFYYMCICIVNQNSPFMENQGCRQVLSITLEVQLSQATSIILFALTDRNVLYFYWNIWYSRNIPQDFLYMDNLMNSTTSFVRV